MTALQFRVNVGAKSPLHALLTSLPSSQRPQALLRLAEAGLGPGGEPVLAELRRIAGALEVLVGRGAVPPPAPDGDAAEADPDPRIATLDRLFDPEP